MVYYFALGKEMFTQEFVNEHATALGALLDMPTEEVMESPKSIPSSLFPCHERYPSLSTLCVPGVITAHAQSSISRAESMAEGVVGAYRNSLVSMRQRLDYEWEDFNLDTFRAFGIATNAESIQFN